MANQATGRIRSGQRKIRVELQRSVQVLDSLRGRTQSWETFATDWAAIVPVAFTASETESFQTFTVHIRYRSDVETSFLAGVQLRVVAPNYTMKVLEAVNPSLRNRDMQLQCARAAS